MKNQLTILLEKVLHKQNQLRPIKTDAALFQFETYNTVLEMIRERIADSEYPTVNAPFVQLDAVESTESSSITTNTTDEFISWFPDYYSTKKIDDNYRDEFVANHRDKQAKKMWCVGKNAGECFPTGSILGLVGKVDEFGNVYDINIATESNMADGSWK